MIGSEIPSLKPEIKEKTCYSLKVLFKNITAGFDSKYGKFWIYQKFLKDQCQKKNLLIFLVKISKRVSI